MVICAFTTNDACSYTHGTTRNLSATPNNLNIPTIRLVLPSIRSTFGILLRYILFICYFILSSLWIFALHVNNFHFLRPRPKSIRQHTHTAILFCTSLRQQVNQCKFVCLFIYYAHHNKELDRSVPTTSSHSQTQKWKWSFMCVWD